MKPALRKAGMDLQRVRQQIETIGAGILPLTMEHIDQFDVLPELHNDVFDRMIIAQAVVETCTVISGDQRLPLYRNAGLKVVWDD